MENKNLPADEIGPSASAHTQTFKTNPAQPDCGHSFSGPYNPLMFIERAYAERDSLSDGDLERLRASLVDQVQRYEDAIRGYSPDKLEKHGRSFLSSLRQKVANVDAAIAARGNGS